MVIQLGKGFPMGCLTEDIYGNKNLSNYGQSKRRNL